MVWAKQSMRADANLSESRVADGACLGRRPWVGIIGIMIVVLSAGSTAFADFLIQPIIMKRQVYPGRAVRLEFRIENLSRDTTEEVSLRLAELTQDANGVWQDVYLDDPNNRVSVSTLRSCKSWLSNTVENVVLDPFQAVPVTIVANVPAGTRGFYFAALMAETKPRETAIDSPFGGALVGLRYLVPVILESQGIPLPHQIELTDVGLTYQPATLESPTAAVIASMSVVNKGGTYSRLQGLLRVQQESGGNWRRIADLKLPGCGIIPGVALNLKQDMGTPLPSGKYKVEGYLYVDGRRGNAVQKEIDFAGDTRVVDPRSLASIDLDKEDLLIDVVPGSSRGGAVVVTNGSEQQVTVRVEFMLPSHMHNLISGRGVRSDDLSCVDWVNVMPTEFTLHRYARRSVNLNVRMPATATEYSHYYGMLRLHATYADGSSAGVREARVCLANGKMPGTNLIDAQTFTLSEASPSRYIATSTFSNGGVTYINPTCRGVLTGPGDMRYEQFLMEASGQGGLFLPFESRTFSGVLDVSNVPVGAYRLTAALQYRGRDASSQATLENAQNQIIIEVYEQGGQKAARVASWDRSPDGKIGRTTITL